MAPRDKLGENREAPSRCVQALSECHEGPLNMLRSPANREGFLSPPRRQLKITTKRRAQLKLQGAYMGYMRQLKPAQKLRVKAVKEKRGLEAAIGVARKLAGR